MLWSCMSPCLLDEFQNFVRRLPTFYALNMSAIQYFWKMEPAILQRYKLLELSTQQLVSKAQRIVHKIFTLSKRCRSQRKIILLRERWGADAYFRWPFSCTCLVVYERSKTFVARRNIKFLQTGFEQQYSFNFSANTMCSVLLSLQLGIMLITPTIYKRFDIQLKFYWSELQRHTWWLGFTAQIFFTSQKSKLPCCEIKLCSVLKEYAKISFLLGRKPNAKLTDQKGFHSHRNN